jgi:hypothetical protein
MNNLSIKKVATVSGLFLGAFALSVLAADWTEAPCAAPGCNTAAPINVSRDAQKKFGGMVLAGGDATASGAMLDVDGVGSFTGLSVAGRISSNFLTLTAPGYATENYVLTNTGGGNAEWKALPAQQAQVPTFVPTFTVLGAGGDYNLGSHSLCVFSGDHVGNNTVVGDQANSIKRNNDGTWVAHVSPNGGYLGSKYQVGIYCI